MKANPLAISAVLLALLAGAVWYTRENPPEDEDAAPKIIDVEESEIREVALLRKGEDTVTVVRDEDDKWQFGGALEIAADDASIDQLVASLASLNAERVVSESVVEWEPYALDEPELAVRFKLAEGGGEVRFGRDTPTGSGVFARLQGDSRLFTVYSYNKTSFEKSVFDLRDKQLLALDEDSIASITVKVGQRTIRFDRQAGTWKISEPMELRADDFTVSDLVRAVRTAEMTAALEGEQAQHSFRAPLATVQVSDANGSHELVVAKVGEEYYARSSSHAGVFGVSATLAESFDKPVTDFRNKKLFDFGFADPARVEVRAGEQHVSIVHGEAGWLLESDGNRELAGENVQTLLDRLRNLAAAEFPSDDASRQASFELASPAIVATVTPEADDGVAETVRVSSAEQAAVYAARDGEPSTYKVEQSAAKDIERAVADILSAEAEGGSTEDASASEDQSQP